MGPDPPDADAPSPNLLPYLVLRSTASPLSSFIPSLRRNFGYLLVENELVQDLDWSIAKIATLSAIQPQPAGGATTGTQSDNISITPTTAAISVLKK